MSKLASHWNLLLSSKVVYILFILYSLGLSIPFQEKSIYFCMKNEKHMFVEIFIVNTHEENIFPMQQ